MRDFSDSELVKRLVRDGLNHGREGTRRMDRKKKGRDAACGGVVSPVKAVADMTHTLPAGQEDNPIRLAWINPAAMTKRARSRARLVMIECGR